MNDENYLKPGQLRIIGRVNLYLYETLPHNQADKKRHPHATFSHLLRRPASTDF
jgi:hypothetical protein